MQDEKTDSQAFGGAMDAAMNTAHTVQAAHAVFSAAKGGTQAAGAAAGTALGGPLGAAVGSLVTSKTFRRVVAAILAALFLWIFIIVNLIGIILSYLGFTNADDFANQAQATEQAMVKTRVEQVLEDEGRKEEILQILAGKRDVLLQEIGEDQQAHYAGYEMSVVDEYETKVKGNLSYYLTLLLLQKWDRTTINSFLGYSSQYGDMSTSLSSPYDAYFEEAARTYNVPVALLLAMGKAESDYNPNAVSPVGAVGIMQLMPATAASLGVSNPYDPRENIMGGAKYVAQNLETFKNYPNCVELAVAAYNAGPGAVMRAGYQVPHNGETEYYVEKVMGYVTVLQSGSGGVGSGDTDGTGNEYEMLKNAVSENLDSFFAWSATGESEYTTDGSTTYYFHSESGTVEVTKETYEALKQQGGNVSEETSEAKRKRVEYTLAVAVNTQVQGSASGYSYKYVTDQGTFELVLKLLKVLKDGVGALKDILFSSFSWGDFISGGTEGVSYYGNIDATGDIITYDTVANCQKRVVYFNQGEDPWGGMPYGTSTIGAAGCGPTSLAIVISTLTGQNVTPEMTCAYSIQNGEYVSGVGTSHSFPTNAAHHWGLTCERVGKDRMDYIIKSLKEGKMVVEICEAYTITGSGSGHFIVLTGVTANGDITIADCASRERTAKVYSPQTILSYGRDLSEGAFWIIGK